MRFYLYLTLRWCEKCQDWQPKWLCMVWDGDKTYHAYFCGECDTKEDVPCRSTM